MPLLDEARGILVLIPAVFFPGLLVKTSVSAISKARSAPPVEALEQSFDCNCSWNRQVFPSMTQETAIIVLLTVVFFMLIGGVFLGISLARRTLDARHSALSGIMADLKQHIPDLQSFIIAKRTYISGSLNGRKIGFKYVQITGNDWTSPMTEKGHRALQIRLKIRETEHDPFYLSVFTESQSMLRSVGGWTEMDPGVYIGDLSGVSLDEQKNKYGRLSPVTRQALMSLAQASGGNVSVVPDWEVNMIGRDAALRLWNQDGVALTQLELHSRVKEEGSAGELYNHILKMQRVVEMLENELPSGAV